MRLPWVTDRCYHKSLLFLINVELGWIVQFCILSSIFFSLMLLTHVCFCLKFPDWRDYIRTLVWFYFLFLACWFCSLFFFFSFSKLATNYLLTWLYKVESSVCVYTKTSNQYMCHCSVSLSCDSSNTSEENDWQGEHNHCQGWVIPLGYIWWIKRDGETMKRKPSNTEKNCIIYRQFSCHQTQEQLPPVLEDISSLSKCTHTYTHTSVSVWDNFELLHHCQVWELLWLLPTVLDPLVDRKDHWEDQTLLYILPLNHLLHPENEQHCGRPHTLLTLILHPPIYKSPHRQ